MYFGGVEKKVCVLFDYKVILKNEHIILTNLYIQRDRERERIFFRPGGGIAERRGHSASSAPCLLLCYTLSRTQNHPNIAQTKPMFKFLIGLKQ